MEALAAIRGEGAPREEVRELSLAALVPGVTVAQDVLMTSGSLLVARGYELTECLRLRLRLRRFRRGTVQDRSG